jgi:hypothetical protein
MVESSLLFMADVLIVWIILPFWVEVSIIDLSCAIIQSFVSWSSFVVSCLSH